MTALRGRPVLYDRDRSGIRTLLARRRSLVGDVCRSAVLVKAAEADERPGLDVEMPDLLEGIEDGEVRLVLRSRTGWTRKCRCA